MRVDKIVVSVGGKETVLTPDEARLFRDSLIELIGPKTGNMPYYQQQPIWIDPNSEEWPNKWALKHGAEVILIVNI